MRTVKFLGSIHPTGRELGRGQKNKIQERKWVPWRGLADLNVAAWCDGWDGDVGVVVGRWAR